MEFEDRVRSAVEAPKRRKRLGQYYTGMRLARLLAALAVADEAHSAIDPMTGSGDMLGAVLGESDGQCKVLAGIEIDPVAFEEASGLLSRLVSDAKINILLGNAFEPSVVGQLPALAYDLVITNPPYVRYQSLGRTEVGKLQLPSAADIRRGLLELVELFPSLDSEDRRLFRTLISGYSGLADLAVPSWILCAILTREGGRLAMVVPETWLSRDYAQVIQYLLLRWFRISYVVVDTHAAWFSDAQVRTLLLVAERIGRRDSAFSWENEYYLHVRLPREAITHQSVVGALFPDSQDPDRALASLLKKVAASGTAEHADLPVSIERLPLRQFQDNLWRSAKHEKWLNDAENTLFTGVTGVGPPGDGLESGALIPAGLALWLGDGGWPGFTTLSELGVRVGQGLRTGANQFFYVDMVEKREVDLLVMHDPIFGPGQLRVPADCTLPVLRKQSELGDGYRLDGSALRGRVLLLHRYALPEDLERYASAGRNVGAAIREAYQIMPKELADFVRTAARTNPGSGDMRRFVPEMSAVRTNVRVIEPGVEAVPRFWYMLPPLTRRHLPDLFVPRVNNAHPMAYLNAPDRVAIDANFSTLWLHEGAEVSQFGVLAVLNSSWCVAAMELSASVMGGGALKLEAAHLNRIPIPRLSRDEWATLGGLGEELTESGEAGPILRRIDEIMVAAMVGRHQTDRKLEELDRIKRAQLSMRSKRRKRQ